MQIEDRKIGDVKPYAKNPRRNDDAVDAVANSIKEFGWQQPIVVDREGVIIVGHTRYKAAKKLKLKTVPVVVVDLDEIKAKGYRIVDNKVAEYSTWDYNSLLRELQMVAGIDMVDFGFASTTDDDERGGGVDDYEGRSGSSLELDPDSYGDEHLPIVCPYCGFRFTED